MRIFVYENLGGDFLKARDIFESASTRKTQNCFHKHQKLDFTCDTHICVVRTPHPCHTRLRTLFKYANHLIGGSKRNETFG